VPGLFTEDNHTPKRTQIIAEATAGRDQMVPYPLPVDEVLAAFDANARNGVNEPGKDNLVINYQVSLSLQRFP
jgi:hypothetical protein